MHPLPASPRPLAFLALAIGLALTACADVSPPITGPATEAPLDVIRAPTGLPALRAAVVAQERHKRALFEIPGVVGTAVSRAPNGRPVVRVLLASSDVRGVPASLDGVPVVSQVTGLLMAWSTPTARQRPAPLGFSVGHPSITAGSIGARVVDASGAVYILSNNHVLANSNAASLGDPILQPGTYDGGTAADQVATLSAFEPIVFTSTANNVMDAAIALTTTANVGNATPSDDGYGAPGAGIFGDANGDGMFDDRTALLGVPVQKFGRTTKLTRGQITGINATVSICYEALFGIFCVRSARFVDQLLIEPGGFSGGGDSGSLIVTDDASRSAVGLLFAGSATQTIANRIDLVLTRFGVRIDAGDAPPPPAVDDVAITALTAPSTATVGSVVTVSATVRNVGTVAAPAFSVSLVDQTDGGSIGTEAVAGLAAGASTTVSFAWNTTGESLGSHTLEARHDHPDANAANDVQTATVSITAPVTGMHIGDLDGITFRSATSWAATVDITVHDANHQPINGATVVGRWSRSGLASTTCTTGDGGGNGTCIVLFPSLPLSAAQVRFTVTSVTRSGNTYEGAANHDPDGDSNGTSIIVRRP